MAGGGSQLSCSSRFVKLLIIITNLIIWVAGCVLLTFGIFFLVGSTSFQVLQLSTINKYLPLLRAAAAIIIVVGSVVFIVSTVGCCAACQESSQCLIVFATILTIMLLGQVVTGILAGVFRSMIVNELTSIFNDTLQNDYGKGNNTVDTLAWNFVQVKLQCCGITGPKDWMTSYYWATNSGINSTNVVPKTCCLLTNDDFKNPLPVNETLCYADVRAERSIYINTQGCYDGVKQWISDNSVLLIGIAVGFTVVQILSILMTCVLAHDVGNKGIIN